MADIVPGKILIADPFLKDSNFKRSVILICEHQPDGSFGFVLNRLHDQSLGDLVTGLENINFPVYTGGPVQLDTIHFLHQRPDLISGGYEVTDGIFWGGDFGDVMQLMKESRLSRKDVRFFVGYSGWSDGQLEEEMKQKTWITAEATKRLIFTNNADETWKVALQQLGGEYEMMVNYPIDPQLN